MRCNNLRNVTSLALTPPEMLNEACFDSYSYTRGSLHVPQDALEAYQTTEWWSSFNKIVPLVHMDVNGDGIVSINDITTLIDFLLGQDQMSFVDVCSDVNGDGQITVNDVVALIDYLLSHL